MLCSINWSNLFLPNWFIRPAVSSNLDFSKTGQIGDTIGGIMGPFIAITASILTFIAFWVQYKANKQQTIQFKSQDNAARVDRFENKLFELIKIYRDNLSGIEIADSINGRKAFISMFNEIRFTYYCIKDFINSYTRSIGFDKDQENSILDLSYKVFFMGIGESSNKLIIKSSKDILNPDFVQSLIEYLDRIKFKFRNLPKDKIFVIDPVTGKVIRYANTYVPFDGHISRLGNYFRHLYRTIKFIAEQDDEVIDEETKCQYAKTLRAQISDYEQLLLYYNINSSLGRTWIQEGFIKRFRMIKNIPLPLADFGILPQDKFKDDIIYWNEKQKSFFEWDERK